MNLEVKHIDRAPENGRFVLLADGAEIGEMTYTYAGSGKAILDHTFVSPESRGGDKASRLMDAAMMWVKEKGLATYPLCPYVDRKLQSNPEKYADIRLGTSNSMNLRANCNHPAMSRKITLKTTNDYDRNQTRRRRKKRSLRSL